MGVQEKLPQRSGREYQKAIEVFYDNNDWYVALL
jgi:hypothetical protein